MKKSLLFILLLTLTHAVVAQDPYFAQAYSAPMTLNPALAGSTGSGRLSGIFKTVGTEFTDSYKAYHFAYDQMINKIKSGVGIYYTNENSYSSIIAQRFGLNFSKPIQLIKEKLKLTPAIELAGQQMNYNYQGIPDSIFRPSVFVFDPGAGILLNSDRLNFGIVVKHFLQPDISSIRNYKSPLNMRYSLVGDYVFGKLDEKRAWKITPGVRYAYINSGGGLSDLQVSLAAIYHKFKFGFAYRYAGEFSYNNSASAQISYNGWIFKFRYTYDFYTRTVTSTRPSGHEVTMLFNIFGKKKKDDFVESPNYSF